ncbi:Beta-barrel assembly machine subunit BamA [Mariprofundus ferrinatatus]|uniref:Outer membrane protein assembly factor BamA n=1 Tax=Mariprofundus ferrinatatus TaxID=1921087 RepID=A0A2K8L4U4_9PROT|nr:outer membrane protein assembly factor BamA [Mariprofundus ferrinatatus]ATX82338.1 Beta-barrel assembly machine subunit BamA [Mariprofundus ferrinatatus]
MFRLRQLLLSMGIVLSLISAATPPATAEAAAQPVVSQILSIEVEGNRFVEKEMVLSKMGSKEGQELSRKQLSRDVRTLHRSGFFSDVRFTGTRVEKGIHLVCHVTEYPLIASLEFEGNEEHTSKDLQLRMKLKPGQMFSPSNQQSDLNTFRKGYLKDGYYQVDVKFIATPRNDGRVDLLVKIHEGEVTHIERIRFVGNEIFSDDTLKGEIFSSESNLASWFSDKDVFDQKRFGADAEMLRQFYLNNGYLDFQIESQQISMTPDKKAFNLTFNVHEGNQYTVSGVDVQGDLVPDRDALIDLLEVEAGDTYDHSDMQATLQALTERVNDEGYAFATVTPLMNRKLDERTVAINFDIEKGAEVYVERIEIQGNEKTEDAVIRRLVQQSEGERYSGSQIQQSKEDVMRSGLVEDVRTSIAKGNTAGKATMKVDVKERRTGSISGGIGYSQQEKVIFNAKVNETNLFGKGYKASLNGEYGRITKNVTANLTDPYLFADNISGSINASHTATDPIATTNYRTTKKGVGLGLGVPISSYVSYGLNYQYNQTNLTIANAAQVTSLFVLAQQGKQTTGELTQRLTWDSRDRMIATTEGYYDQLTFSVAGLGGNEKFYEAAFESKSYFSFGDKNVITFNPNLSASMISGYSNMDTPLYRRYSMGGVGSLRGFDTLGVSLRDPVTKEPVGGDKQVSASLNVFFPIPFIDTTGVRAVVFADAGTVWGAVNATVGGTTVSVTEALSLSRVRYSAGFGFEWMSPIGPIGVIWAYPIRKVAGDVERSFEFVLGTSY